MPVAGGLRTRYIQYSFYRMLNDALADLGWFDSGRDHLPINPVASDIPADQEIPRNTLAVSWGDYAYTDIELGSTLAEHVHIGYVDFYAENDSVGSHMIHDVAAILAGRLTAIGRNGPTLQVYDYTLTTPALLFTCTLEDIVVDKAQNFPRDWQRHWWACRFSVVDEYADDVS